jgi:C_GCAxxG_C_C family probable redox protein
LSARIEEAVGRFVDGYSCAQSLLSVYGPPLGLDEEMALKISSPLGGGFSRTDGPCGAATGAILVLGCAAGHRGPGDDEAQERIRTLTQEFLRRYNERKGSTLCTDILGHNLSEPGVAEKVKAEGLSQEPCPEAVRTAAELIEELLEGELR